MPLPAKTIRVVVVGSVRLYREGLADALRRRTGLAVVGTHSNLQDALARLEELAPDVMVFLDMMSPSNLRVERDARPDALTIPVVALGSGDSDSDRLPVITTGTATNLTRDTSLDELVQVIESTGRGGVHGSPLSSSRINRASAFIASSPSSPPQPQLTPREHEIGQLLKRNLSNKEIARILGIEVATVKNHIHSLLEKLRVHRRTEAARIIKRTTRTSGSGISAVLERRLKK